MLMQRPVQNPNRWTGYQKYGDERAYLMSRYQHTRQSHQNRVYVAEEMMRLWSGVDEAYFPAKKRDDEERVKTSRAFRIVEMMAGLIWNKEPALHVAPINGTPASSKSAGELESDLITMFRQWKIWPTMARGVWWSVLVGVGLIEYRYNPLAMDDEPLMIVDTIDPRFAFWKESKLHAGTVDHLFTATDEYLQDVIDRYGTTGSKEFDRSIGQRPMDKIKVYTYWCVERALVNGKPQRIVISAAYTDYGWLREPEVMAGYTQVPVMLIRGADYPLEHVERAIAYMPALLPIRDELIAEVRMLSALLTQAKYHVNPGYVAKTNRTDFAQRVTPERGGLSHLYADEDLSPLQKTTTQTPDVVAVRDALGKAIAGGTVPEILEGTMTLDNISGISLSMATTGPLLRFAKRQQLIEDALERFLPAFLGCLGRHSYTQQRTIIVVGPHPQEQDMFYTAVISPHELLDPDIRIIAKMSSSLPRDSINEITTLQGLGRDRVISKHAIRGRALELFDLGATNADQEAQRIMYEILQDQQFEQMAQFGQVSPAVENDYVPPGYQRSGSGATQLNPTYQRGPGDPLIAGPMVERKPGPRYGPAVHDQLTGNGADPTTNPLLLRRRGSQMISRTGQLLVQPRRATP